MPLPDESSSASFQHLKAIFEQDGRSQTKGTGSSNVGSSSLERRNKIRSSFIAVDSGRALGMIPLTPARRLSESPGTGAQRSVSMPVFSGTPCRQRQNQKVQTEEGVAESRPKSEQTSEVSSSKQDASLAGPSRALSKEQTSPTLAATSRMDAKEKKFGRDIAATKSKDVDPLGPSASNKPGKTQPATFKTKHVSSSKKASPVSAKTKHTVTSSPPARRVNTLPKTSSSARQVKPKSSPTTQVTTQPVRASSLRSVGSMASIRSNSPTARPPSTASVGRAFGRSASRPQSGITGTPTKSKRMSLTPLTATVDGEMTQGHEAEGL